MSCSSFTSHASSQVAPTSALRRARCNWRGADDTLVIERYDLLLHVYEKVRINPVIHCLTSEVGSNSAHSYAPCLKLKFHCRFHKSPPPINPHTERVQPSSLLHRNTNFSKSFQSSSSSTKFIIPQSYFDLYSVHFIIFSMISIYIAALRTVSSK
jgi:hypothetical protein